MPDREYGGGSYNSGYGLGGRDQYAGYSGPVSRSGMDATNQNIIARQTGGDLFNQGRGSNVTDARPQSPAEVRAGVVPAVPVPPSMGVVPAVPVPPGSGFRMGAPFFTGPSLMTLQNVGVPTINLNYGQSRLFPQTQALSSPPYNFVSPFQQVTPVIVPSTTAQREATKAAQQAAVETAIRKQNQANYRVTPSSVYTRGSAAKGLAQAEAEDAVIRAAVGKTLNVESGNNPFAKSRTSSASGVAQFTKGTWDLMVNRHRPDLRIGRSAEEVYGLRSDPNLSTEMATFLARDNADSLSARGLPVNENTLYLSHFLGVGDAIKVLRANPDTPIEGLVNKRSITANQSILGGGKTVADITRWAGKKMANASPVVPNVPIPVPRPPSEYTLDTAPPNLKLMLAGGSDEANIDAVNRADLSASGAKFASANAGADFAVPGAAAQAASANPETFSEFLSNLFNTQRQISKLEEEGRTGLFPDAYSKQILKDEYGGITPKEYYRRDMETQLGRKVEPGEIKSRIVDYGQGPVVDYYIKDLTDVFGEAITGLVGGIGGLFKGGGEKSYLGAESDRSSSNVPRDNSAVGGGSQSDNRGQRAIVADLSDADLSDEDYFRKYGRRRPGAVINTGASPTQSGISSLGTFAQTNAPVYGFVPSTFLTV